MDHRSPSRRRTTGSLTALLGVAAAAASLLTPLAAHAGLAESNAFSSWTAYVTGAADVTSTADTTTFHGGEASLKLVDTTPKAANVYGGLLQPIAVEPSTTYEFSAWVKADSTPAAGPLQIVLSPDWNVRQTFATGTFDWKQVTWSYTTTDTQTAINFRLIQQNTGTYWLDDLSVVKSGTTTNLVANGGFEEYTAAPPVTDPTLTLKTPVMLFDETGADVSVASNRASVQWTLSDPAGTTLSSGDAPTSAGLAALSFTDLEPGYYDLSVSVDAGALTRNTSFAILAERGDTHDTAFAVSDHLQTKVAQADVFGDLGVSGARFDLSWTSVEKVKGEYTFDAARDAKIQAIIDQGTRPLLILDYRNAFYDNNLTPSTPEGIAGFAAYAAAVAEHYGTTVDYEVYNEYNIGFNDGLCGRTADCYLDILEPTYTAIKTAVPDATVVGPAIAGIDLPWLTRLFELGGLDYLDVVSVHTYDYPNAPEGRSELKQAQLAQLIRDYNDGEDKPLWMTEFGWSTASAINTDAEQAKYLVRGAVLLQAAGTDKMFVYDLLEDGTDSGNREHRFGLLRNGGDGLTSLAPKQGYVAYAVLTRMLEGHEFVGAGDTESGAYAYEYAADGASTWVLWSTSPKTVHVHSDVAVTVTSMFGASTEYAPENGIVELTLGDQPVYVSGAGVTDVTSPLAATYSAEAPAVAAVSEGFGITVTVDNTDRPNASTAAVTFRTASTQVRVPSKAGAVTTATLAAPAIDTTGATQVSIDVLRSGGAVAHIDVPVTVVDNQATVTARPHFDGGAAQMLVSIENRSTDTPLQIDHLSWAVGELSGDETDGLTVAPGTTEEVAFDVTGFDLWRPYDYSATVSFSDGFERTVSGRTAFSPVVPEGEDHTVADLDANGTFVQLSNETEPSTGGTMWLSSTDTGIVMHAVITDPAHDPAGAASQLYNGDSIQISFAPGLPEANGTRVEYGVALLDSGVGAYRFSSPVAAVTLPDATIVRDEDAKTTTYAIPLTWAQIGVASDADAFSYSFLVNDAANGTRMGYVEWASGIGKTKDVTQHLPVTLTDAVDPTDPTDPTDPEAPAAWSADATYAAGDEVSYDGAIYVAQWYAAASDVPGASKTGAWAESGAATTCAAGDADAWTASWVYTAGTAAIADGHRWVAQWWTRGSAPADSNAAWKDAGTC